jgi:hypothetical protein
MVQLRGPKPLNLLAIEAFTQFSQVFARITLRRRAIDLRHTRANDTMKRRTKVQQKQARPGTVTDARGITLSAGVAAFNAALDKESEDIVARVAERGEREPGACGDREPGSPPRR